MITEYKTFETELWMLHFTENDNYSIYCPAIDCMGIGQNFTEASNDLQSNIIDFLEYTWDSDIYIDCLEKLGWLISAENYISPDNDRLISGNEFLQNILKQPHKEVYTKVSMIID